MRITYCWTEPSGYLTACITELARRPEADVSLFMWEPAADAPFSADTLGAAKGRVLTRQERDRPELVEQLVAETRPDVLFFSGWSHRPYRALVNSRRLSRAKFVIGADSPIRFDWRQWLAPLRIGSLLRRVDAIVVPGERGYQLMRYWGVPGHKVARLLYGIDYHPFAAAAERRRATHAEWPKQFLYAGRYVDAKGIDVLIAAYAAYRRAVANPWPLVTCGTGPLRGLLTNQEGITDKGFLQPAELASAFADAGALLLPSRYEPWGQVIVEAAAAGLPVICTQACGAGADLVRDFHNGALVPTNDSAALARAMLWMHEHYDQLPEMGRKSQVAAAAYSAERWADNQLALAARLLST
jgi:glycosyltransferase involved in cell wall biosynthesis